MTAIYPIIAAGGPASGQDNFYLDSGTIATVAGTPVTILTYTVPVGKKLVVSQIFITTPLTGKIEVDVDAAIIATARTAPGAPNVPFTFLPARDVLSGETITVKYTQRSSTPATDIEGYLQGTQQTA